MTEAGLLRGGIGMAQDHRLVPMFDFFRRMLRRIFLDPFENGVVFFQTMDCVFEDVAVDFEKAEEMFIEPDGFIIVPVEQAFAMQLRLINQTREMNVAAEFFVRTARMQSSHETSLSGVRGLSSAERHFG